MNFFKKFQKWQMIIVFIASIIISLIYLHEATKISKQQEQTQEQKQSPSSKSKEKRGY